MSGWLLVALALLLLAVILGLGVLFWPRSGLIGRLRRLRHVGERVRVEDALKHVYHASAAGHPATAESLAGVLEVTLSTASRLIEQLAERHLVKLDDGSLALSEEGRRYALRIVRTHRLWERYLADRTGVAPPYWHELAERREHQLTEIETNALAARMGHPAVDPHGDPIPTPAGELPARSGIGLPLLGEGESGRIVHLEDEPRDIYDKLLAQGLSLSLVVTRLPGSGPRVRFRSEGSEHELDAVSAANVTVERVARELGEESARAHETLARVPPGESAFVVGLSPACQGPQRRRLLDLGVVPGTRVTAEFTSAGGDPTAYRVRGALVALRRKQAEWVYVTREDVMVRSA